MDFFIECLDGLVAAEVHEAVIKGGESVGQLNGRCCDDRSHEACFHGGTDRSSNAVIAGSSQFIAIQAIRDCAAVNSRIQEQRRLSEQFCFLKGITGVQRLKGFGVMQLGVSDLVDNSRDCLHLAHTLADGDALAVQREETVRTIGKGLEVDGNRRRSSQSFHEDFVVLDITGQVRGQLRQRLAVSLRHIKDRNRLEHGDFDFFFLGDYLAVCIQQRQLGVGIDLFLLDLLFVGRRRNDLDAFFALPDVAFKLITPLVEAGDQSGVGPLHIDEHGVVDAVLVEPAHCAQILSVFVRLEQLLYPFFNAVGDVFESFLVGWLFGHRLLLSRFSSSESLV